MANTNDLLLMDVKVLERSALRDAMIQDQVTAIAIHLTAVKPKTKACQSELGQGRSCFHAFFSPSQLVIAL